MKDIIEVACLVFPSGEAAWIDIKARRKGYVLDTYNAWVKEHPEYRDSGCSGGMVTVRMPRENYDAIPATNTIPWPNEEQGGEQDE